MSTTLLQVCWALLWVRASAFLEDVISAQRRRDVSAIDRGHVAGRLERGCMIEKRLRDVLGGDLAPEQVAGHVIALAQSARRGTRRDQLRREQAGADAVGVDRVGADAVLAV